MRPAAAALAGLRKGDVILELDGRPARATALSSVRRLLRTKPAGTHVPMLVQGHGGTRRIVLTLRDQI
jgi:C-terminal processing protease CtpA/Prc